MICHICPHFCELQENEVGKCGVIFNYNNSPKLKYYGNISSISVDSIEKRPFFHIFHGSKTLAVGFYGCQLSCDFCFNYKVSQNLIENKKLIDPSELVDLSVQNKCKIIAFTFNEPTIYFEYLIDVAKEAFKHDVKLIVKSNGYINIEILEKLSKYIYAFNIDIKGDEFEYSKTCGGSLDPVINSIKYLHSKTHLEISYLVLPKLIENFDFHSKIRDLVCRLDSRLPIHLIYYYMFYKMNEPNYMPFKLIKVYNFLRENLDNVYISNLYDKTYSKYRNTYCARCKQIMIDRSQGRVCIINKECCNL